MAINDHSYIIIGGSTKCASTSLFAYLAEHPQVSPSRIKETRFFWAGDYDLKKEGFNFGDGIAHYDTIFNDKAAAKFRLEATPDYLYSLKTAQRIKNSVNDARFLFIFRQPVDRIVSWYKFSRQLNLIAAGTSIDEYINDQLNSDKNSGEPQFRRAVEQGRYAKYLEKYIELFGKDKIKVLSYEELSSDPGTVMINVCGFLKIDSDFYNTYDFKVLNQSVNVKNAEQFNKYRTMRRSMRRTVKSILPGFLSNPFKKVFKKVDSLYVNSKTGNWEDIKISAGVLAKLNEYYKEDKELLDALK